jgi:tetratricopeptide (TPR) repeat protein
MTTMILMIAFGAGAYDAMFDKGVELYYQEDYAGSVDSFEQLISQGVENPAVFCNLGNGYYRMGKIAPAIANYERALRLDPSLVDVRANLFRAVEHTERRLSKPAPSDWEQSLLFWHYGLSKSVAFRLALGCWFACWGLLALRQFKQVRYLRRTAAAAGLLAVLFAASTWAKSQSSGLAVANAPRVPVHYGNNENETVRFELYEGDRVHVDTRSGGWARLKTANGERGWAPERYLIFIDPPYGPLTTLVEPVANNEVPR